MKTLYNRYIIIISLIVMIVFPCNRMWSCGPELEGDAARFVLFQQNLAGFSSLEPFYYNNHFVGDFDSDPSHEDYMHNCKEWQAATGNATNGRDIYAIEYEVAPDEFLYSYNHNDWGKLKNNTFVKWLRKARNKKAMQYFAFAKEIEFYQTGDNDPWTTYNSSHTDSLYNFYKSHAKTAIERCENSKSGFMKERYAFQAVKLLYYQEFYTTKGSENDSALANLYDKYLKNKKTILANWALVYYALSLNDSNKRTLALVKAFLYTESKKAYTNQFLNNTNLTSLENIVRDTDMLADIAALKAIKNPGRALPEIQKVFDYNPKNKYLPLLICREVNKLEDWILSPEILGFNSVTQENIFESAHPNTGDTSYSYFAARNLEKDKLYMRQVRSYFISMLQKNYRDSELLKLAIVHLYHIDHQFGLAQQYLTTTNKLKDAGYEQQKLIEEIVSLIYTRDINNQETQQILYEKLNELQQIGIQQKILDKDEDYAGADKTNDALSELYLMLSEQYKKKGNIVTAGLLFEKSNVFVNDYYGYPNDTPVCYARIAFYDKYASPRDIDTLISFKYKKNKSLFEKIITPKVWAPDDFYLDLKGTLLIRQKKFDEALVVMNKINDSFWVNNYEYNHYLPKRAITSVGTLLPGNGEDKAYPFASKKLILNDIITLTHAIQLEKSNGERAKKYFLLGNAYYNMTYQGKAWMMYSYGNSTGEGEGNYKWAYYSFPDSGRYANTYYECADAINMYRLAYRNAGSQNELAAKCLLMLALCDKEAHLIQERSALRRNRIINYYDENNVRYYSPYLSILKKRYENTRTFTVAQSHCPDVIGYLKTL